MKTNRILAVFVLVVLCSLSSLAQGTKDPKIIIHAVQGGGASPTPGHCPEGGCTPVGVDFEFSIPQKGPLFFNNASEQDWISLTLIETGVAAENVSCAQNLFLSCSVIPRDDGSVQIVLSGIRGLNPRNGILAGANFSIGFACVQGNCWPRGLSFTAHAGTSD
jgi:hypothetical protein